MKHLMKFVLSYLCLLCNLEASKTDNLSESSSVNEEGIQKEKQELTQGKDTGIQHFQKMLVLAYQGDDQIKAALLSSKSAQLSPLNTLMTSFIPQVSAQGSMGHTFTQRSGVIAKQNYQNQSGQLQVTQNLFNGGAGVAAYRMAKSAEKTGEINYNKALQDFLVRAVKAYVGVVIARKTLEVNKASEKSVGQQLEAAKVKVEVGDASASDLALAESELAKTTAQRIQAEASLEFAIATYQDMFLELPPAHMTLPEFSHLNIPQQVSHMCEIAMHNNYDIQLYDLQAADAYRKVTVTTAGMLPKVDANATAGRNRQTPNTRFQYGAKWQSSYGANVTVTIPFINNGQTSNFPAIAQAQLDAASAQRTVKAKKDDIRLQVIQSWQTANYLTKTVAQNEAQVKAAKTLLNGTSEEYKVGTKTFLDVMDAEAKYLSAQVSLLQNQQNLIQAIFGALQICGTLRPENLGITESLVI